MKKRKTLVLIVAALFTLFLALPCFAAGGSAKVVDNADLFTDSEEYELSSRIDSLVNTYGMDFVIYTDVSTGGQPRNVFAADFYEANGYGIGADTDGSVWFVCMESGNRGWYTAIHGQKCISHYDSDIINTIDDSIEEDMSDGAYFSAAKTYLDKLEELYSTGKVKRPKNTGAHAAIAAVIALIAGGGTAGALTSGMKKVRVATEAGSYLVPNSFKIRRSRDHFLYLHVTRIKRETDNNKGGKSGFGGFSSSSGGSFSGGGRDF